MRIADVTMLKVLYGDDVDGLELWKDEKGEPFLFGTLAKAISTHFNNAKNWFSEHIGIPLKKYLFDEKEGLLPRMKDAFYDMFDVEEKKRRFREKKRELSEKFGNKLKGTKTAEGQYEGGLLSGTVNGLRIIK